MKEVTVITDSFTDLISSSFDYKFSGISYFEPYKKPSIDFRYNIGLIVGASGTGKTTLLSEFGNEQNNLWDNRKAIISHFNTPQEGIERLSSVGLNSIPSWCKPYHVLSTGEKFRADLALKIKDDAVIDEFTSVVDRNVAKATSYATQRYIRKYDFQNIVFSTCHEDVIEWLDPDWIFNTNNGELLVGRSHRRPDIAIKIFRCTKDLWGMFKNHHYLSGSLNKSSRCYCAIWNDEIIGFTATLAFPFGKTLNAWREHRTVILPDYQGLGFGVRLSDAIAQLYIDDGKKYYSKTAHPRMGEYRNNSPLWKPTSKNRIIRNDIKDNNKYNNWSYDARVCYSHEYIGT